MPNYEKIIPGLDALTGEPEILTPEKDTPRKFECIGIPDNYIQHVDKFYQEQSGRGDACRKLMQIFNEVLTYNFQNQTEIYTAANGMKIEFIDTGEDNHHSAIKLKPNGSQAQAINTAKSLSEKNKNSVAIMTGSDKLSALASLRGIDVVHINPEVYTGRRQVPLPLDNATNLWYSNKRITAKEWEEYFPGQEPLRHNEFVEFTVESFGQVDHKFTCQVILPKEPE